MTKHVDFRVSYYNTLGIQQPEPKRDKELLSMDSIMIVED